ARARAMSWMGAHVRLVPELLGQRRRDVAAGQAKPEARLLLPEHRLTVVAERHGADVVAWAYHRPPAIPLEQRRPVETRGPQAFVRARHERQRHQAERDPAQAAPQREAPTR